MLDGALGLAGNIDFAFVQPSAQIVRRQIDQHHFAGLVKHVVGHRFAHPYAGHTAHHVVQTFQMLYVDGSQHVDAGVQQLFHILPTFGVARTVGVAVRQFVHQDQRRMARQRGVEVEFMHQSPAMLDALLRQQRQAVEQGGGLAAAVGFHHADQHVQPLSAQTLGLLQHGVGFAHAGAGAEEYLQPAARFFIGQRQQAIGIGTLLFFFDHDNSLCYQAKRGSARRTLSLC
ncbi:Uncharacterised protein [Acinetobacter baumannii]|nr:Uncharacterised protein [Acinetobacter baumannii]